MEAVIIGTVGFLLYFIYDTNSICRNNRILQKFFAAGSICVCMSVVWELLDFFCGKGTRPLRCLVFGGGAGMFFALLVYTLFFALPFKETYVKENHTRLAYTNGVYALCRHPGMLWFAGLFLCLWAMTGDPFRGAYFLLMIFWDLLYIVYQDLIIFPRTFSNYKEYKESTPFLLPNKKSVKSCFCTQTEVR